MSSEQIFMTAPQAMPEGMTQHTTHKAFAMMDADNPSDYQFNHVQGDGIRGTLVPVPSPNGGIKGSDNPFGKIVMGTETKMINGRLQEVPFTPTWLGDAIRKKKGAQPMAPPPPPTPMPDPHSQQNDLAFPDLLGENDFAAKEAADAKVAEDAAYYKEQARLAVQQQAQAEAELAGLIEEMNRPQARRDPSPTQMLPQTAPAQDMSRIEKKAQPGGPSIQDMQQFAQMMAMWNQATNSPAASAVKAPDLAPSSEEKLGLDPNEVEPTLVKLSGQFGTSRGKYKYVHITDAFVILVYDEDANIFTPPASESTFKLSCNGSEYEVYFAGVEFELPFYKTGVQVMIRS